MTKTPVSERERGEEGGRVKKERGRRESENDTQERREGGGEAWRRSGGLSCAGVLSSGGRGCWETNESSRHLVHTGDCLSIQITVFRPA